MTCAPPSRRLLGEPITDLIPARVAHLMRVAAFEPGIAQAAREKRRLAANSKRGPGGIYTLEAKHAAFASEGEGSLPRFRESWDWVQDIWAPDVTMSWRIAKPVRRAGWRCTSSMPAIPTPPVRPSELKPQTKSSITRSRTPGRGISLTAIHVGDILISTDTDDLELTLRSVKMRGYNFLNVRKITLKPSSN